MQNLETGEIVPIDPAFLEGLTKIESSFAQKINQFQRAKDAAIPDRTRQGPVFEVGEEIEIRGGKFRVHAITDRRIYLDSLPAKED